MVNPNWSFDIEANYQNPRFDYNQDLWWSQYGVSFDVRRHFIAEGRNWNPYVVAGLGWQRSEEEFDPSNPLIPASFARNGAPSQRDDNHVAGKIGVGLQGDVGPREDPYGTRGASRRRQRQRRCRASGQRPQRRRRLVPGRAGLGRRRDPARPAPVAPVGPAPTPATCADKDDDGDGVNNCDDKCPGSVAGQAVGPDGCPVPLTIDLKGVNFDFDKSKLRPDAIAILDEAIGILQRLSAAARRSRRSHRPVRHGCVQPVAVGASRARRVRLPDQPRRRCVASGGPERLRREPSAREHPADAAGVQERA